MFGDYGLDPTPDGNDGLNELGIRLDAMCSTVSHWPSADQWPKSEKSLHHPWPSPPIFRRTLDIPAPRARPIVPDVIVRPWSITADTITDVLGLLQKMGVQKHRRARGPGGPGSPP